jgi:hypothetical protein
LPAQRPVSLAPVLCFVKARLPVDLPQQCLEPVTSFRVGVENQESHTMPPDESFVVARCSLAAEDAGCIAMRHQRHDDKFLAS